MVTMLRVCLAILSRPPAVYNAGPFETFGGASSISPDVFGRRG